MAIIKAVSVARRRWLLIDWKATFIVSLDSILCCKIGIDRLEYSS